MRFGTKTEITKFRDYQEAVCEAIYEQRVEIMKIQDFDALVAQLHIDHALQDHGAWIEYKGNKMYAVLKWIERN